MCDQVAYTFLSGVGLPAISKPTSQDYFGGKKLFDIESSSHVINVNSCVNENIQLYVTVNVNIPLIYGGWTNEN